MQFVHGRMRWWVQLGLAGAAGLGVSCNVIFGINEYSDDAPSTSSGGGTAGSGGTAGTVGNTSSGGSGGADGGGGTGGAGDVVCTPDQEEPCYGGPPGSQGIGACKDGVMVCNPTGDGFGPCEGAIEPEAENCDTVIHESCKDDISADCGTTLWSISAGANDSDQQANGIAVDAAGDVFVVGTFGTEMSFGAPCAPLISKGLQDAFFAKLDGATGKCKWAKSLGGAAVQIGKSIAVSGAHLYITGTFAGSSGFPDPAGACPLVNAGADDVFVAKIDPSSGECIWATAIGDNLKQEATSIFADTSGNALLIGNFAGAIALGTCSISAVGSADDVFAAKLGIDGNCLWARQFGDQFQQHGKDIAANSSTVALTGDFIGTLTSSMCEATNVNSSSLADLYVTRLDHDGNCISNKDYGDGDVQLGQTVAMDAGGNTYAAGTMAGSMDFGNGGALSADRTQIFLAKLDVAGNHSASRLTSGTGLRNAFDLAVGGGPDQIFLVGSFNDSIDFGTGLMTSAGEDVFVTRLTADLTPLWSKRFGDGGAQRATGVAVGADGGVAVVGYFTGSIDFGGGPTLTSTGGNDVFVAKLSK